MSRHDAGRRPARRAVSVALVLAGLAALLLGAVPALAIGPSITGLNASPSPFTPNADGYQDTTTIAFTTAADASVRVQVLTAGGAVLATPLPWTQMASGQQSVVWNGKYTDAGGVTRTAADAVYEVVVQASDAGGTTEARTAVTIDSTLRSVSLSASTFYGGAGSTGTATLRYTLARTATVSVLVRNAAGRTVRTLRAAASQAAGTYSLPWGGTGDGGAQLPEGTYTLTVSATSAVATTAVSKSAKYYLTPVASEASLAVGASGGYVLHAVVERWSETLNSQTSAGYYFDGLLQPWELTARSSATLTLYVGTDPVAQADTTLGGSVVAKTDSLGVADLAFPAGLTWYDAAGDPVPLYYSLKLSYSNGTRWYPASGRYPLRAPTDAEGHLQFAFFADIQTPRDASPTPNVSPGGLTAAKGAYGPYTDLPRLGRSLGWSAVLAGLRKEPDTRLVLGGGDQVQLGSDSSAPDDGTTQLRTLFDNQQSFSAADEWSLASLTATVPLAMVPGNHEGITSSTVAARWSRWAYSPSGLSYYSFDRGDVHFVMLNDYMGSSTAATNYKGWIGLQSARSGGSRAVTVSGTSYTFTNSPQADWLISAVQTAKPWTVVVMHYPMFDSANTSPYADATQTGRITTTNMYYYGERNRLLELFAAQGVDVVLQGHLHNFRHHMEKVRSADGAVTSAISFVTDGHAGAQPVNRQRDAVDTSLPFIDWVDLDRDGVADPGEPAATEANGWWDAASFGSRNSTLTASGYFGAADALHPTGEEYDDGLSFSYTLFRTGSDASGDPTLTMTVKRIAWDRTAHAWGPWTVAAQAELPQVGEGMVPRRLSP